MADGNSKKLATFLDLPAELRNTIYHHALVPQTPIELAPMLSSDFDSNPSNYCLLHPQAKFHYFNGEMWHRERYTKVIQPSLALLRVCRQIHQEGSGVYYGQEFRFTNSLGWHILYHWLMLIGRRNNRLVTNITVSHPGITGSTAGDICLGDIRFVRWELKVSPVKTNFLGLDGRMWPKRRQKLRRWVKKSDPTLTLISMTELRHFRLVLLPPGKYDHTLNFASCQAHPINKETFPRSPNIQLSYLNLVRNAEAVQTGSYTDNELRIDVAYAINPCPWNRWHLHERGDDHREEARQFFDWVKQSRWKLEELHYDNHYTYPVPELGRCNNEEVCQFIFETGNYEQGKPEWVHWPRRECTCPFPCALICREEEKFKCSDDDCDLCWVETSGKDAVEGSEDNSQG